MATSLFSRNETGRFSLKYSLYRFKDYTALTKYQNAVLQNNARPEAKNS